MTDLVQRLRDAAALPTGLYAEAADEIERLRAAWERATAVERERCVSLIRKCSDNGSRPGFSELAARIAGKLKCVGPECQGCMECDGY